ncbi:hypothetical protein [Phenylobacterium sp.]|jgi:LacI family repressor for deo operon, udp, cdd, tsx, nupC, and nupG|uniref:hypothetical protein n=1 Tax=Phenylobacterium sp. TaxID=1871053 RepID=UPI0037CC1A52
MSGPLDSPLSRDRLRGSEASAVRHGRIAGLETARAQFEMTAGKQAATQLLARAPHAGQPKGEIVEPTHVRRH